MNEIKTSNLPTMSVDGIVESLSSMYSAAINGGLPLKKLPSALPPPSARCSRFHAS